MAETNWLINDSYPVGMAMEFLIPPPWSSVWWGGPISMVMDVETHGGGGGMPDYKGMQMATGAGFFGPKE